MIVENKNTYERCWRSSQMCFHVEYAKHILFDAVILAYSATKIYGQNGQNH